MSTYDHREPGWFIPLVEDEDQAARVKAGVIEFNRELGSDVTESGIEALNWMHDGEKCSARVGEPTRAGN